MCVYASFQPFALETPPPLLPHPPPRPPPPRTVSRCVALNF